jgi:hypothetical protein
MKEQLSLGWHGRNSPTSRCLNIFARIRPGVSARQAEASIQPVYKSILSQRIGEHSVFTFCQLRKQILAKTIQLLPAAQGINVLQRNGRKPLIALMAMVSLLLLIACAIWPLSS